MRTVWTKQHIQSQNKLCKETETKECKIFTRILPARRGNIFCDIVLLFAFSVQVCRMKHRCTVAVVSERIRERIFIPPVQQACLTHIRCSRTACKRHLAPACPRSTVLCISSMANLSDHLLYFYVQSWHLLEKFELACHFRSMRCGQIAMVAVRALRYRN